jgi:DNA mismatch repair ATPase MutL
MKPRFQSQQFPAHMSEYYKDKELNEDTLRFGAE